MKNLKQVAITAISQLPDTVTFNEIQASVGQLRFFCAAKKT